MGFGSGRVLLPQGHPAEFLHPALLQDHPELWEGWAGGAGELQGDPCSKDSRDFGVWGSLPCPCHAAEGSPWLWGFGKLCWTQHSCRMGSAEGWEEDSHSVGQISFSLPWGVRGAALSFRRSSQPRGARI